MNRIRDPKILNERYHLWRGGKYLGIATFVDDEILGESFIRMIVSEEGKLMHEVYVADYWVKSKWRMSKFHFDRKASQVRAAKQDALDRMANNAVYHFKVTNFDSAG